MFFRKKLNKKSKLINLKDTRGDVRNKNIEKLLITAQNLISKMQQDGGAKFEILNTNNLQVNIRGVCFNVECEEDLFIVNEIFNELCYGCALNNEYTMIDIGANIGVSIMYFSQNKNIETIYGFEPVLETYNKCLVNLSLNTLKTPVKVYNVGLGDTDHQRTFTFSPEFKGSVGKIKLSDYKSSISSSLNCTSVVIRKSSDVFNEILNAHPNKKLFVKMDCEGGEEEIIPDLYNSGMLNKISLLVMEWHQPEFLSMLSMFDNFTCFYHKNSLTTGILYAYNKSD